VLLGWYWENHDTCVSQNHFFAACVRAHPDRLSAFAAVQPKAGAEALSEVRRARNDGLVGIGELCPHQAGLTGASPEVAAVLALAGELGLPVNLHVTDPTTGAYPGRVETPLEDFLQMARAHPRTMFILAHWAGGLDVRALDNVCVDTAAAPLIYRSPAWERIGVTVRPDQVLFGSDYPLNLYPKLNDEADLGTFVAEAKAALPDAATRSGVLGGNARRVLSLPG
jgi:predicted TIM-barrel fold metal-dependent hydrolase